MDHDIQHDIQAMQSIPAIPTILEIVCQSAGMGFAVVARVTEDRWIACQVLDKIGFGLPAGGELDVETTLCHEVRRQREVIVIDNVADDPAYCNHLAPKIYNLQSYVSVPIILPDGRFFGTLCAIDSSPATPSNPQTLATIRLFADLIGFQFDAAEKLNSAQASLVGEKVTSELREQFIAVLGHDLRNPIASLGGGINVLQRQPQSDKSTQVLNMMRGSVLRMSALIENVMDFARGRLGGGIALRRDYEAPLGPTLDQVISEIQAGHPERRIEADYQLPDVVGVDHHRIAQMFSNLLGNAITHGSAKQPIRVEAAVTDGELRLSVTNSGAPIPVEALPKLFQPFKRTNGASSQQGLGLGLYIASQIAEAHGGSLDVNSDESETRFTFRMPIGANGQGLAAQ